MVTLRHPHSGERRQDDARSTGRSSPTPESSEPPPRFRRRPPRPVRDDRRTPLWFGPMGQYDLPRWREGGITLRNSVRSTSTTTSSTTRCTAVFEMTWQPASMRSTRLDGLLLATSAAGIRQAKGGWEGSRSVFRLRGLRGAGGPTPRFLDLYHKLGLRAGEPDPQPRRNIYADGCRAADDDQGGLTAAGQGAHRPHGRARHRGRPSCTSASAGSGRSSTGSTVRSFLSPTPTPTMFPQQRSGFAPQPEAPVREPRLEIPRDRKMLEAISRNGGVLGLIHITHTATCPKWSTTSRPLST